METIKFANRIILITTIAFILVLSSRLEVYAQNKILKGYVTCYNKVPLAKVQIKALKNKKGTISDSLGRFSIPIRDKGDVIKLTAQGFIPIRYTVKKVDSVKLNMVFVKSDKNKEMVTAYGYVSEKELTYAMTHLSNENNQFQNYTDIFDILSGTVAGVWVDHSHNPPKVNIRSAASVHAGTEPLFIIDGITAGSEEVASIQPSQVKAISVIKDGEAAVYGTRGANGVIVIELNK